MGCCFSSRKGSGYKSLLELSERSSAFKQTRGNEENAEMLISNVIRRYEGLYDLRIPHCINYLCLLYFYENTNVIFDHFDGRNSFYVSIKHKGKKLKVSSNTIFVFSDVGYDSGFHSWHVKLHNVFNCQALGIAEKKDATYRYGYNVFDSELNQQLGDRYIYAGDTNHGWRGSTENRPYIFSANDGQLKYRKNLKLKNNRWERGDVISVELDCNSDEWTIAFLKNGQYLFDKIKIQSKKMYYPVFQVYQRGSFEIVDAPTLL